MRLWKKIIENLFLCIALFCSPICLLYLGGPVFCNGNLQSRYNFGRNVYPLISFTICGVPPPNVTWSFHGEGGNATSEFVKSYMYKYLIRLPQLTQETCGRDLVLNVTGYNSTEKRLRLFLDSCKYWNNASQPWRFLKFHIV